MTEIQPAVGSRTARRMRRALGRFAKLGERAVVSFHEDHATTPAAAISYYALFSIFPLALLLVAGFGLVIDDGQARRDVLGFLVEHIPVTDAGRDDLRALLADVASNVERFGIVGLVGLLIAASGLMGSIRTALNDIWDVDDRRPPVQGKLVDLALVAGLGILVAASLGISVAGRVLGSASRQLERDLGSWAAAMPQLLLELAPLLAIAVSFVVFAFVYQFVPARPGRLRDVWPGALLAAVLYEVAKWGFSVYVENFARYNAVYGSLATVVAFIVFVFLAANLFLLGAEAAKEWPLVRAGAYDGGGGEPLRQRLAGFVRGLFVRDSPPDAPANARHSPPPRQTDRVRQPP